MDAELCAAAASLRHGRPSLLFGNRAFGVEGGGGGRRKKKREGKEERSSLTADELQEAVGKVVQ